MNGPLRSKQGCYSCKLRKKKCDEGRPRCLVCESLSITCYGYGPKPDWMKDREKERAVANSLKEIVKHTSRRNATTHSSKPRNSIKTIAPKSSNDHVGNSTSGPSSSRQHGVAFSSDHGSSQEDEADMLRDGSANPPSFEHGGNSVAGSMSPISAHEYTLVMHFLDNVFPLQYPMYKPRIIEGGRGWLLAVLLRTKPLYHAAMALSAYHGRMIVLAELHPPCRVGALVEKERHLETCIKSLSQFVQGSSLNNGLGILTSVVQLVFLELFTGNGNAWLAHLRAAMTMYQQGHKENYLRYGLTETTRKIICEDVPLPQYEPLLAEEVVNFRFLSGTIIWLDIISAITAGTAPYLLHRHTSVIASNSQTQLENLMGCQNWVMLQIGRIAALHRQKTQALQQAHFDCTELELIVSDISREIQSGLTQGALESFNVSELDSATAFYTTSDPSTLVTNVFAYMASVYLHLVTHGFQRLEELDATMFRAMRTLQSQVSIHLLPALVLPLYIIGSVAKQGDRQFFRNAFSSAPLLDPIFEHRRRVLPILEEIWARSQITPGFSWQDSLELTNNLLLL